MSTWGKKTPQAKTAGSKAAGRKPATAEQTATQGLDKALSRDARRLLAGLAEDGAAPARADLRDGFLVVAAPRNGVTAIIANAPAPAGEELAARALALWSAHVPLRLEITPEGASLARRLAAPDGVAPHRAQHGAFVLRALEPGARPVAFTRSWVSCRREERRRRRREPEAARAGPRIRRQEKGRTAR